MSNKASINSLDDISYQINQSDCRHTFKLLLVKNDYQYDVLKDINNDLEKQVNQINDVYYLLRLPEKQIRFDNKLRQKYQNLGIELRLIKQQSSWHLKSLLEILKQIVTPPTTTTTTADGKISIENSPSNQKNQEFEQQQQPLTNAALLQPIYYQAQNLNIDNSVFVNSKNTNNACTINNYSNSNQQQEPTKMQTERDNGQQIKSKTANSQQENGNQTPEKKNIVPIINKFTQEYLKTRGLSDMDYCTWIFEVVSIFQTDSEREEAQQIISRNTQFYKELLSTQKEQQQQQLMISTETILLLNKPTNNNSNATLTQLNSSSFSQLSSARKSKATTTKSPSAAVKKQKLINENKFAPDEVSNQLASTNQAKKKLIKNQQQGEDKKKQQQLPIKKQQQTAKNTKHQQTLLFDSQGMTRSQLKKLTEISANKFT